MKPEQLKVIAEGMGYKSKVTPSRRSIKTYPYNYCPKLERWKLYNPLTNNDQMVEIMEKLKVKTWWNEDEKLRKAFIPSANNDIETGFGFGKTINEAVCNAAYEYFKRCKDA